MSTPPKQKHFKLGEGTPLKDFETTPKHLKDSVYVIRLIREENDFLVWGYDIIKEVKRFFGAAITLDVDFSHIALIQADPSDEKSLWIYFKFPHSVDYQLSDKSLIKVRPPRGVK